jgi:hypothetical protein
MCGQSLFLFKKEGFMALVEEPVGTKKFEDVMSEIEKANVTPVNTVDDPAKLEEAKKAEEARLSSLSEEERKAEEAKKIEDARLAVLTPEERQAEEARKLEEVKKAEVAKRSAEQAQAFVIPEELKTVFPDAQSPADIVNAYQDVKTELKGEQEANEEMVSLFNKEPELVPLLKAVASGKNIISAIRSLENIEERLKPPDFEDREAYDAYKREEFEKEQEKKAAQARSEEQQKIAEVAREHAIDMREKFIRSKKMSADEAKDFLRYIQEHTYGDPKTGKLPQDTFDIFFTAYTHKDEVAKLQVEAEKKKADAELAARNEGIRLAAQAKLKKGDGIPALGGGVPPAPISEADKLKESFQTKRVVVETPIHK